MRRLAIGFLPAVLLAGLALSATASAHDGGEHLHFIAKTTGVEKADLGDGGKQVVVSFDVFEHDHETSKAQFSPQDHARGGRVGHGTATCVTTEPGMGALCTGAVELDDGQLSVQGIVHRHSHEASARNGDDHSLSLPVTGGSGKFFGTSGEMEISHAGDGSGGDHETMDFGAADHASDHEDADKASHGLHLTFHLD